MRQGKKVEHVRYYVRTFEKWQSIFISASEFGLGSPIDVASWVGYQLLKGWSPKFIIDNARQACSENTLTEMLKDVTPDWAETISSERLKEFALGNPMAGLGWEWGREPLDATIGVSTKALNAAVKQAFAVAEVGRAIVRLLLALDLGDGTVLQDRVKGLVLPEKLLLFTVLGTDQEDSETLVAWERLVRVRVVLCVLGHIAQWMQMDAGALDILTKHTSDQAAGCLNMVDGALRNLAEAMTLPGELVGSLHDVAEKLALLFPPHVPAAEERDQPFPEYRFGEDFLAKIDGSLRRVLVMPFDTKHPELLLVLRSISGTAAKEIVRCVLSLPSVALQPNPPSGNEHWGMFVAKAFAEAAELLCAKVSAVGAEILDCEDVELRCARLVLLCGVSHEFSMAVTESYLSGENSDALFAIADRLGAISQVAKELEEILHSIAFYSVSTGLVLHPHKDSVQSLLFPAGAKYIPPVAWLPSPLDPDEPEPAQMLMPPGSVGGPHRVFSAEFSLAKVDLRVVVSELAKLANTDYGVQAAIGLFSSFEGQDWWDEVALDVAEFLTDCVSFLLDPLSVGNFFDNDTFKNFVGLVVSIATELHFVLDARMVWKHGTLDLAADLAPTVGLSHLRNFLEEQGALGAIPTESQQLLELAAGGGRVFGPLGPPRIHSVFPRALNGFGQSTFAFIGTNIPRDVLPESIALTYRSDTPDALPQKIRAIAVRWVSSECLLALFSGQDFGTAFQDGALLDLDLDSGRLTYSSPGGMLFSHLASPPVRFDTKVLAAAREDARLHIGARSLWSSDPGSADPASLLAPFWLCAAGRSTESRESVLSIDPNRHTAFITLWDTGGFAPRICASDDWQVKVVLMEHEENGKLVLPGIYTLPSFSLWTHPVAPPSAFGQTLDLYASGLTMADGGFVHLDLEGGPGPSPDEELPEARMGWAICRSPSNYCVRITVSEVLQYVVEQGAETYAAGASPLSVSRQAIEVGLLPLEVPAAAPSAPLRLQVRYQPHSSSVLIVPVCERDWNPTCAMYRYYVRDYSGGYVEMASEGDFTIGAADQAVKALSVRHAAADESGPGLELYAWDPPAGLWVRCERRVVNELPDGTLEPVGDIIRCEAELRYSANLGNSVPWGGLKWKTATPIPASAPSDRRLPSPLPKPGRRAR